MIDLRSDTVTRPTPAMREAMASAEVGDDVYSEDPTINRLEKEAAEVFDREASIFVPTGTMGNQIAIRLHTQHGEEVICEARSHVLDWEMAMMAAFLRLSRPHSCCGARHFDVEPTSSQLSAQRSTTGRRLRWCRSRTHTIWRVVR